MPELDAHQVREVAVNSYSDPRTVEKFLRGERVRGPAAHRIRAALEQRGINVPPQPANSDR